MGRILVVEGMPSVRESVRMILGGEHDVRVAATPEEAARAAADGAPDLVLAGGPVEARRRPVHRPAPWEEAVRRVMPEPQRVRPLPVPFAVADLRGAVRRALAESPAPRAAGSSPAPGAAALGWRSALVPLGLRAADPAGGLARLAARAAASALPVLVVGERGTGRETLARYLHAQGPLANGPLHVLACAGLSPEAFAVRIARIAQGAPRPTLFLKALDDASPALQEALLDLAEHAADGPRILASASDAVFERAERGLLSEPLLEALGVLTLALPPLREAPALVGALAAPLLEQAARDTGRPPRQLSPAALERLELYCWPGNLRELAAVLARSAALAERDTLEAADLDFGLGGTPSAPPGGSVEAHDRPLSQPPPAVAEEAATPPAEPPVATFVTLAGELAHELKNPLVAVKTFTQLLAEKFDDAEFRREFYRVVRRDVERIDHLVEAMVQVAGAPQAEPVEVDIAMVVDDVLSASEAWMVERRVVAFREIAPDLPRALADGAQLRAALFNVVARALASSAAGEDLFVSVRAEPGLRILVTYHDPAPNPAAGPGGEQLELALARLAAQRAGGRLVLGRDAPARTVVAIELPSAADAPGAPASAFPHSTPARTLAHEARLTCRAS
jgi:DNA-binding NtrC family response regulator